MTTPRLSESSTHGSTPGNRVSRCYTSRAIRTVADSAPGDEHAHLCPLVGRFGCRTDPDSGAGRGQLVRRFAARSAKCAVGLPMTSDPSSELALRGFESHYVCLECGQPLYGTPSKPAIETCLTPGCSHRNPRVERIVDISFASRPDLLAESQSREADIALEISRWRLRALARRASEGRRVALASAG